MNTLIKFIMIVATVVTTAAAYAEPDQATQIMFKNLMAATISNNYDAFVAECDAALKAALTKPMLEGVSKQIGPRVKQGYDAQYLGELTQQGYQVHLWRLRFRDGGDDTLAALSIKDGKAGGFALH